MNEASARPPAITHGWDLPALLHNRRWVRRSTPFPHVVASDVFVPEFYAELEGHYRALLAEDGAFERNMAGYDASAANLAAHADGPLGIFVSREWHDLVAGVAGVGASGDVHATVHHHDTGSASGWPHNDLNPGWFPGSPPGPGELRLSWPAPDLRYATGPTRDGVEAHETIRAVSVLFYLANGPWRPGDGGETALYASSADAARTGPATTVAPMDNSLILFECTPFTWHTFLTNRVRPRESLVMWLHRSKQAAVERWGDASIAYWT
jgi:hypothetical protein